MGMETIYLFKSFRDSPYINGMRLPNEMDTVADLIILLAKQYTYTCKVQETKPTNNIFQNILYRRYQIQKEMRSTKTPLRGSQSSGNHTQIFSNPS